MARNLGENPGIIVWMLNEENASKGSSTELNLSMLYIDQGHSFISCIVFYDMNVTILFIHFYNTYFGYL